MGIQYRLPGAALALIVLLAQAANAQDSLQDNKVTLPPIDVSSSRLGTGIVGASTTIITAEDIARSPRQSLPDILSREPGVQTTNLFGGVNGSNSVVDMRGFGATAASNTLILIDGRRITDIDLAGVDLSSIPRDSIERIEVTRGNSGVVLYGDGAVGGVINIVTKTGVAKPFSGRVEAGFGSFKQREGNVSVAGSNGPWSTSAFTNAINSDGYRVHNFYRQLNGVGDIRYSAPEGSAYLRIAGDNQYTALPGARRVDSVTGLNQLLTDRQGATTPWDWAKKNGFNVTGGVTRMLSPGAELIMDGGFRYKQQQSQFYTTPTAPAPPSSVPRAATDTELGTFSFTPRVNLNYVTGGMPWKATGGIDFYRAKYDSARPMILGGVPLHDYHITQDTIAAYWQQTITVLPTTDISYGGRIQTFRVNASDNFNLNAPGAIPFACFPPFGCFGDIGGLPFQKTETNKAFHLGAEHRFNSYLSVFGRMASAFRVPNVDERVGAVTAQSNPTTFDLRTQRSHDYEAGFRVHAGPVDVQWSAYDMYLTDEIHFRYGAAPNFDVNNINLDPTRRYGHETIATLRASDVLRFKAGVAYTRSVFRSGEFAGNDVPLVSKWTGSIGVSWDIFPRYLTFDGVVRYIGPRRMDNDQANLQPLTPTATVVDARFGGEWDRFFWSFAIQNLFNVEYFDYAIASPFPNGPGSSLNTYNAYPLPGRSYMLKAGATF
jgi:iron complex outermembrane receptor protein